MKRFLVFGYDSYYPSGGVNDVRGDADTIEDARKITEGEKYPNGLVLRYDAYDILDMETWEWVE